MMMMCVDAAHRCVAAVSVSLIKLRSRAIKFNEYSIWLFFLWWAGVIHGWKGDSSPSKQDVMPLQPVSAPRTATGLMLPQQGEHRINNKNIKHPRSQKGGKIWRDVLFLVTLILMPPFPPLLSRSDINNNSSPWLEPISWKAQHWICDGERLK